MRFLGWSPRNTITPERNVIGNYATRILLTYFATCNFSPETVQRIQSLNGRSRLHRDYENLCCETNPIHDLLPVAECKIRGIRLNLCQFQDIDYRKHILN